MDPTYTGSGIAIYSVLEPTLGVVNACLPVIRPAIRKLGGNGFLTWGNKTKNSTRDTHGSHAHERQLSSTKKSAYTHEFERFDDDIPLSHSVASISRQGVPHDGNNITIKREWEVSEQSRYGQPEHRGTDRRQHSQEYAYVNKV
jgi:hypothetical protein